MRITARIGLQVNRSEELALAWALVSAAKAFIRPTAHARLCAKIGAGDHEPAIRELIAAFAGSHTPMASGLIAGLLTWVSGYSGSEHETALRELVATIRVDPSPGCGMCGATARA